MKPSREGAVKHQRSLGVFTMAVVALGLTVGCGNQNQPEDEGTPSFASIEEVYGAVDRVLSCEVDPIGDPIVPADGVKLTSEQWLCAEDVQVDLYPDENAQQKGYEIWTNSGQGEVRLVRGTNWMVVDATGVTKSEPATWDLKGLAEELNGEYVEAGT